MAARPRVPERTEIVARALKERPSSSTLGGEEGCGDDGLGPVVGLSLSDWMRVRVRELGLRMLESGERRPSMEVSILVAWSLSHHLYKIVDRWLYVQRKAGACICVYKVVE